MTFQGDGTAVIKGISLPNSAYVNFNNLEAMGSGPFCPSSYSDEVTWYPPRVPGRCKHQLHQLYLHDALRGVTIGGISQGRGQTIPI